MEPASRSTPTPRAARRGAGFARAVWAVVRKELLDAQRDRRTLVGLLLTAVATGPAVLLLLSYVLSDVEAQAESREVVVVGLADAPTLANHLLRRGQRVVHADRRAIDRAIAERRVDPAILVVPPEFERDLADGLAPRLEIVAEAGGSARGSAQRLRGLVEGFAREQAALRLALRGVPSQALHVVDIDVHEVSDPSSRAAEMTGVVPLLVMLAMISGVLASAVDATAGERERGSLEPLLMTPAPRGAIAVGKWLGVATFGLAIAALSCLSFLPGRALVGKETLAALFSFGPREALLFVALLAPLAAAASALMLAIALRSRTVKEAQMSTSVVVIVASALASMSSIQAATGSQPWHAWVPVVAQASMLRDVLAGRMPTAAAVLASLLATAAIAALALLAMTRRLRGGTLS